MNELVGDKIKRLRKSLKLPQKSLALNICDQSEISRIENNKYKPSYEVLKSISERLGVDVNYFLEDRDVRGDYVKEVKGELYRARRNRDYIKMEEILDLEIKNPLFQKEEHKNYLHWNKGIVLYELHKKKDESVALMLSCLSERNLDNLFRELDIDILNAIGLIFWAEKELKEAKYYLEKAYEITKKLQDAADTRVRLKTMYNLSKVYTDLSYYKESLELCKRAIKVCKYNEDMFLYAEFHYQLGRNYLFLNIKEKGLTNYEKSKYLFEFDEDKRHISKVVEEEINIYKKEGKII